MNVNTLFLLPMLAAAPYAMIDTRDIPAADIKHSQIYIRAIDGKGYMDNPVEKKVTPGVHWVVMTRQKSSKSGMKRGMNNRFIFSRSHVLDIMLLGVEKLGKIITIVPILIRNGQL